MKCNKFLVKNTYPTDFVKKPTKNRSIPSATRSRYDKNGQTVDLYDSAQNVRICGQRSASALSHLLEKVRIYKLN